jgi:hypothetical protein
MPPPKDPLPLWAQYLEYQRRRQVSDPDLNAALIGYAQIAKRLSRDPQSIRTLMMARCRHQVADAKARGLPAEDAPAGVWLEWAWGNNPGNVALPHPTVAPSAAQARMLARVAREPDEVLDGLVGAELRTARSLAALGLLASYRRSRDDRYVLTTAGLFSAQPELLLVEFGWWVTGRADVLDLPAPEGWVGPPPAAQPRFDPDTVQRWAMRTTRLEADGVTPTARTAVRGKGWKTAA